MKNIMQNSLPKLILFSSCYITHSRLVYILLNLCYIKAYDFLKMKVYLMQILTKFPNEKFVEGLKENADTFLEFQNTLKIGLYKYP